MADPVEMGVTLPDEARLSRTFALLAPNRMSVPPIFTRVATDDGQHVDLLAKLQRLRGSIYLEDGAIESWQLTEDGRHSISSDETSWHLLSMRYGEVAGCARLQVHAPTIPFCELAVAQSALAESDVWGPALRLSVMAEMQRAQVEQLSFIEAGGWALAPELRCTTEALHIALGSYALGELLGGCLGLSTATLRHHSASILKRLGGFSFMWDEQALPAYYDPAYRCEMELVRFDSRMPSPKYRGLVDNIKDELALALVLCGTTKPATRQRSSMALANVQQVSMSQRAAFRN